MDWLRKLRKERGMTQMAVATAAGIAHQSYSFIETGRRTPTVKAAKRIAAVLGFEWTRFFELEEGNNDAES